jgi:hypothetical protein
MNLLKRALRQRSVTVACLVTDIVVDGPKWDAKLRELTHVLEFEGAVQPPERVGWQLIIEAVLSAGLPLPVGLIVDSELGQLEAINNKTEPLCGDFVLPNGFRLIYASGERGTTEYIGNAAVAACDAAATTILNLSALTGIGFRLVDRPDLPFRRFRCWRALDRSGASWSVDPAHV